MCLEWKTSHDSAWGLRWENTGINGAMAQRHYALGFRPPSSLELHDIYIYILHIIYIYRIYSSIHTHTKR